MSKKLFALVDWETTGLTSHPEAALDCQPRAIEFGGVVTDGDEIISELGFLINPHVQIEPIITKITGISQGQLDGQPEFSHFIPVLKDFFSSIDCVIAHNMAFDKSIATCDLRRAGHDLSAISWPAREFCTVELTKPFYGRRMKLEELYNMHVGEIVQSHRAVDDCKLLFSVCQTLEVFKCL